jgi:hypothetical protein
MPNLRASRQIFGCPTLAASLFLRLQRVHNCSTRARNGQVAFSSRKSHLARRLKRLVNCGTALGWGLAFVALCAALPAQTSNTISVRLLDGRTGLPVKASNFVVRVDHHDTDHPDWVTVNDDGTVLVTIPADAKEISLKATYGMGMDTYINCDAAKESDKERNMWYSIATILSTGIVAPDECALTKYKPKPGEFTFFVRKRSWHDQLEN